MTDRILVTGGAGFIGSNFCRYLLRNTDYSVVCLDRLDEAGTLERVTDLKQVWFDRFASVWHDLKAALNPEHRSLRVLREPFRYIVHMAAGSHVDRSIRDPIGHILDNVLGTGHALEYARRWQPDAKFLYFSTDEVFGPAPLGVSFTEHSRWEPNNPYAATKAGGEALCPAYAHQYGLRIAVTHCTNIYGPEQYAEKFIPLCVDMIEHGQIIQIHSLAGVSATRYYVHVNDVSAATLTVLEKGGVIGGPDSGRYNISGDEEWSNLEVAQKIAALLGKPLQYELVENPPGRPKPDMRYALRGEKLRALGWAPRISLDEGLRQVVLGEAIGERAA